MKYRKIGFNPSKEAPTSTQVMDQAYSLQSEFCHKEDFV